MSLTSEDPYFIESVPQYKDFLLEHDDTIGDRFFDCRFVKVDINFINFFSNRWFKKSQVRS